MINCKNYPILFWEVLVQFYFHAYLIWQEKLDCFCTLWPHNVNHPCITLVGIFYSLREKLFLQAKKVTVYWHIPRKCSARRYVKSVLWYDSYVVDTFCESKSRELLGRLYTDWIPHVACWHYKQSVLGRSEWRKWKHPCRWKWNAQIVDWLI